MKKTYQVPVKCKSRHDTEYLQESSIESSLKSQFTFLTPLMQHHSFFRNFHPKFIFIIDAWFCAQLNKLDHSWLTCVLCITKKLWKDTRKQDFKNISAMRNIQHTMESRCGGTNNYETQGTKDEHWKPKWNIICWFTW